MDISLAVQRNLLKKFPLKCFHAREDWFFCPLKTELTIMNEFIAHTRFFHTRCFFPPPLENLLREFHSIF